MADYRNYGTGRRVFAVIFMSLVILSVIGMLSLISEDIAYESKVAEEIGVDDAYVDVVFNIDTGHHSTYFELDRYIEDNGYKFANVVRSATVANRIHSFDIVDRDDGRIVLSIEYSAERGRTVIKSEDGSVISYSDTSGTVYMEVEDKLFERPYYYYESTDVAVVIVNALSDDA